MKVELLHHTPLWVASKAIRKCWASEEKSDTVADKCGVNDRNLIYRVGNKNKHSSTLEHLNYSFDIDGISRACLQELARHRMASFSVKSTRYTLKELKEAPTDKIDTFLVNVDVSMDQYNLQALLNVRRMLREGKSNDKIKFLLPEAYKTSLVLTINARSFQNFLSLRTDRSALWEIQDLARAMYDEVPEEHKYLFEEFVKDGNK